MINEIDVNQIVVSSKPPFSKKDFKYFIGFKDDKRIRPWCILFRRFDENSFMYVLIKEKINILINIMKFGKKLAIL